MPIALEPCFIHLDQVANLVGAEWTTLALERTAASRGLPSAQPYAFSDALATALPHLGIREFQEVVLREGPQVGQVIGLEQAFYFQRQKLPGGHEAVIFHGKLNTASTLTVRGKLNPARFATDSASHNLSGRARVYLVGTITDVAGAEVTVRPAFVGYRSFVQDEAAFRRFGQGESRQVYPSEIDQFRQADFRNAPTTEDINTVRQLPEQHVKKGFAEIIGELDIPKDWGGEEADLYSGQLFIAGKQASSAWLFKGGPGFPGAMTITALGKNGDQIDRLYKQPAEVLVLQHHREVRAAVVNMMLTYANDSRSPRRFMILNGASTATIFRAYGKLSR
jgi:hypothetical protein